MNEAEAPARYYAPSAYAATKLQQHHQRGGSVVTSSTSQGSGSGPGIPSGLSQQQHPSHGAGGTGSAAMNPNMIYQQTPLLEQEEEEMGAPLTHFVQEHLVDGQ